MMHAGSSSADRDDTLLSMYSTAVVVIYSLYVSLYIGNCHVVGDHIRLTDCLKNLQKVWGMSGSCWEKYCLGKFLVGNFTCSEEYWFILFLNGFFMYFI